jgi:hypothetical protein
MVAGQMDTAWEPLMPMTAAAFNAGGRAAP